MKILFAHHYFPGQFQRMARHYLESGKHEIVAFSAGLKDGRSMPDIEGIRLFHYGEEVGADRPEGHVLYGTDQFVREAASLAIQANDLKASGWYPDLVYSHTGWGTGAFLHDIFPAAKFVKYCEWFYNNTIESTEFLTPDRPFESRIMTSLLNLPTLADLARADLMIAPTEWQKRQFPPAIADKIAVVPDGVDMDVFRPSGDISFRHGDRVFTAADRLVTYVARGADPFRGFAQFMAALSIVQKRNADIEAMIVGDQTVYYGPGVGGDQYFQKVMATAEIDPARTHFTGTLPYDDYRKVLQISAAHVYLTVPFVLSWSALEALATGCLFIGSDTAPVREFVTHGENGLLADFFDSEALASLIEEAVKGGQRFERMRTMARQTIRDRWEAENAIRQHESLVERLLNGDQRL